MPTVCPRCHEEPASETHETLARSQYAEACADLLFMVPVGAYCHRWITHHKGQAHDEGWVLWSYERDDEEAIHAAAMARLAQDVNWPRNRRANL